MSIPLFIDAAVDVLVLLMSFPFAYLFAILKAGARWTRQGDDLLKAKRKDEEELLLQWARTTRRWRNPRPLLTLPTSSTD